MKSFLVVALFFVGYTAAQGPTLSTNQQSCKDIASECCKFDKCESECSSLILEESTYDDFVKYSNDQLIRSYEYLFMAAQFSTHSKDRPGFEKVLHGLADGAWAKGIEMIQEASSRGVRHSFKTTNEVSVLAHADVNEVEALSLAVEIEKKLLIRANDIHRHHSRAKHDNDKGNNYDAGLAHYLEEEIIEDKTDVVRTLVGHVNDLKNIFNKDSKVFALALYLFDQHLQK